MWMIFLLTSTTTLIKVPREKQNLQVTIIVYVTIWCIVKILMNLYIFTSEFSEFCDVKYRKVVHHINVRWLSLQAAVDRALLQYLALKSYFLSKGEVIEMYVYTSRPCVYILLN